MASPKPSSDSILRRLRKGCMGLPDATETVSFGHPTFQVNGKTFAVFVFRQRLVNAFFQTCKLTSETGWWSQERPSLRNLPTPWRS